MPSLKDHQSNEFTKMLFEGDSGSGKTGGLCSLVKAGFNLRILDLDNGLDPLKTFILRECPDRLASVEYRTIRDEYSAGPTGPTVAKPKAFVEAVKMLDKWKYDDVDMGDPAKWGPQCILVVDSLTFLSDAAFNWAVALNPGAKDPRQWYGTAQDGVEKVLAGLTSETFKTNVIVISHIKYVENPDGSKKGYPTAVGSALSPVIPRYFNSVALAQTGAGGKRTVQTAATAMIDLKNPRPFEMAKSYPIETGLAEFFAVVRGASTTTPTKPEVAKPQKVTLVKRA